MNREFHAMSITPTMSTYRFEPQLKLAPALHLHVSFLFSQAYVRRKFLGTEPRPPNTPNNVFVRFTA